MEEVGIYPRHMYESVVGKGLMGKKGEVDCPRDVYILVLVDVEGSCTVHHLMHYIGGYGSCGCHSSE